VGPSVSLSILGKRKIPYSCQKLKLWCPGCVVCRLVSVLTETPNYGALAVWYAG
jgi:hypothetical protein